ncbi:MAG: signal recognition particle protein [Magnetovibrio sp.]|nr:signal recognition particle protein [Magnetovibrio sp.]|tara:strand:+ start:100 stop:1479 length:1380 start_codon:yes stop_codon:yes gene_type:complete
MFDSLSDKLSVILEALTKRGALKEADVEDALEKVRVALLDADVAIKVVKDFISSVREKAIGQNILKSVTPGQMVVKIVHDELTTILSGGDELDTSINLSSTPPVTMLMIGLQGSGKTTTTAKLASLLTRRENKKVLLSSLDIYRPAAQQQLAVLAEQINVRCLDLILGEQPIAITKRALQTAQLEGFDVLILDTAGRLHIDDTLMQEVASIRDVAKPTETLLVADAMTGQDAVNSAREFNEKIGITGIALTRVDGDARGGAALSMRAVTGQPIKFIGTGEKTDAIEEFNAERIAGSILGMGDIIGLVEKAQQVVDEEDAERITKKMLRGQFTLEDMAEQLRQVKKMGSLEGLLSMLPGAQKVKKQISDHNLNDGMISRQEAIILSMTLAERRNPKILNGSRRRRIASGSGTSVQDVNRLLKQFKQVSSMMKKAGKKGKRGMGLGLGNAMIPGMTPPGIR